MCCVRLGISLILLSLLASGPLSAQESVERFGTARGGSLRSLIVLPPGPVRGVVILFVGGTGKLRLARGRVPTSNNFLFRSRGHFARLGFVVAIPDAPDGRGPDGLVGWRTSAEHVADIGRLAKRMRRRFPVPVWLIGTSRGAISAAAGARLSSVAGVIFAGAVTRPGGRRPATVFDAPVREIAKPALVIHHQQDGCRVSPPSGAGRLFARLSAATVREIRFMEGGKPAVSRPCRGLSPHGFYGVERQTVAVIAKWISTFER